MNFKGTKQNILTQVIFKVGFRQLNTLFIRLKIYIFKLFLSLFKPIGRGDTYIPKHLFFENEV